MLAIAIFAEPKIRAVECTRYGVALHGTLDMSSWDKGLVKFASMNVTDWMNIMVQIMVSTERSTTFDAVPSVHSFVA